MAWDKKKQLKNSATQLAKKITLERFNNACELCVSGKGVTAHHFYYRSSCGHLLYDLENLICICMICHARLHFKDPKLMENKIVAKRGRKWFNRLTKKALNKPTSSYITIKWLEDQIKKLKP